MTACQVIACEAPASVSVFVPDPLPHLLVVCPDHLMAFLDLDGGVEP